MVVVIADPEPVTSCCPRRCIELGCNVADVSFGFPASWIDVRLNDRLDAELACQRIDCILVFTQQVDVCCRRGQAVWASPLRNSSANLERERLNLGEPEPRDPRQGRVEVLLESLTHGVQLDGQFGHEQPL